MVEMLPALPGICSHDLKNPKYTPDILHYSPSHASLSQWLWLSHVGFSLSLSVSLSATSLFSILCVSHVGFRSVAAWRQHVRKSPPSSAIQDVVS